MSDTYTIQVTRDEYITMRAALTAAAIDDRNNGRYELRDKCSNLRHKIISQVEPQQKGK